VRSGSYIEEGLEPCPPGTGQSQTRRALSSTDPRGAVRRGGSDLNFLWTTERLSRPASAA